MIGLFKRVLGAAVSALALTVVPALAQTAQYPSRPITLVVPFPVGTIPDIDARLLAQTLTAKLGQSVVVENKPGAAGIIGTQYVANAKPDGYTLLWGTSGPLASHPSLYKKLPYSLQSFTPVNGLNAVPLILVVNSSKNIKTLEEFVDYLKSNPGKGTFGSLGVGSGAHLTGELFQAATGTKMIHSPYKEGGALYADLLAGRIDAVFDFIPTMREYMKAGSVVAVAATDRLKGYPGIPAFHEKGFDVQLTTWQSIVAPAGTPAEIVRKLSAAIQSAGAEPEIIKFDSGNEQASLYALGPDKLRDFIVKETDVYRAIIKKARVSVD